MVMVNRTKGHPRRREGPEDVRSLIRMVDAVVDAADARAACRGWDPEGNPLLLSLVLTRVSNAAKAGRLKELARTMPAYT